MNSLRACPSHSYLIVIPPPGGLSLPPPPAGPSPSASFTAPARPRPQEKPCRWQPASLAHADLPAAVLPPRAAPWSLVQVPQPPTSRGAGVLHVPQETPRAPGTW